MEVVAAAAGRKTAGWSIAEEPALAVGSPREVEVQWTQEACRALSPSVHVAAGATLPAADWVAAVASWNHSGLQLTVEDNCASATPSYPLSGPSLMTTMR